MSFGGDMEPSLQSSESLDRASPELWPDRGDYAACAELLCQDSSSGGSGRPSASISPVLITDQDFTPQDMKRFHGESSKRGNCRGYLPWCGNSLVGLDFPCVDENVSSGC